MFSRRSSIVGLIALLMLAGCNTIEHRPEKIVKSPLPKLTQSGLKTQLVWSNSECAGSGKKDAKLKLAVTSSLIYATDYKGKILALDRLTGERKWRMKTDREVTAGPAVVASDLLVGTEEGQVLAYQDADGQFLWKANLQSPILAAPEGNKDAVFIHVLNDTVFGLKTADGHELWRYQVNTPPLMLRRSSKPLLVGNVVIVGFSNGKLIALNAETGIPEWEKEIAVSKGRSDIQRMVDIGADPIYKDKMVYAVSYQGRIAALDIETGSTVWEKELSAFAGLTATDKALYVPDSSGVMWAFDRKSGNILWKQTGLSGRSLTQPVTLGNFVIVGDEDGYLHWMSESDGAFVGQTLVDSKGIETAPVVKEEILYVLGRSGKISAFTIFYNLDSKEGN